MTRPQVVGQSVRPVEISLSNPNGYVEVDLVRLRGWLAGVLAAQAEGISSLAIRFVGDRAMRALNTRYRDVEGTTDVLSFAGEETPEGWHLGDLAISVPVARRQAAALGHSVDRELKCLVLHGVLHCLGHDHETDDGRMSGLELELRERWVDGGQRGRA